MDGPIHPLVLGTTIVDSPAAERSRLATIRHNTRHGGGDYNKKQNDDTIINIKIILRGYVFF